MKDITITLPHTVFTVLQTLESHGFEACIVGGCVRDILRGILHNKLILPKDWDIATDATSAQVIEVFSNNPCFRIIPIGLQYGTLGILQESSYQKNPIIEVTTYRIDGRYSDSRKPDNVIFTRSLERDLARRDFSINAIACSLKSANSLSNNKDAPISCLMQIHDYFQGIQSLKTHLIACVGDALEKLQEDALRIMRALRFSATLEPHFDIDSVTKKAMFSQKTKLSYIAKERIQMEFNKLLLGKYATQVALYYKEILHVIYPEIALLSYQQYTINMRALQHASDRLSVRLALFFNNTPFCLSKMAQEMTITKHTNKKNGQKYANNYTQTIFLALKRLRYDNKTISASMALLSLQQEKMPTNKITIKNLLSRIGTETFWFYLQNNIAIAKALESCRDTQSDFPSLDSLLAIQILYQDIIDKKECFSLSHLDVRGDDILAMMKNKWTNTEKIKTPTINKKQVGIILQKLLDYVIANHLSYQDSTKEELLTLAETLIDSL
ncbi:CCA tRNA nucleotidyltransferase [Helicobacter sp. MIT 14-3879]|uniref:CCA tRNA nucleotidyltransferase n=1 Tax=Helicobacter sp. MIT 14-3879 TaxID=2040649 RepID=UPI000E1F86F5|nr:hypothetical protein [Helicobacter sp. MIT 14-3879]RDU61397.1 hypothetical protein CQA44_09035 [Helicobacter sp. MIT 14-3879]